MKQLIVERFQIFGRGLVVVLGTPLEFPAESKLNVIVTNPDGSQHIVEAYKEMILRRMPVINEHEAYLLNGLSKEQVQEGACIEVIKLNIECGGHK